ncbi:hypothetical protein PMIN06_012618 [Paraphaeosphaeria minitans]
MVLPYYDCWIRWLYHSRDVTGCHGEEISWSLVTFITYWSAIKGAVKRITGSYQTISLTLVNAERVLQLLQTEPSITDADSSKELVVDTGEGRFKNVEFAYDPRKPLITSLNLVAEPGKTVAVVGTTGGGKSTLLKLRFRLYDPCEGSITIDGHDIRHVRLSSLRSAIGIVPQNPTLFNGTIRENIRYARLDATYEQIIDVCKAAAIHDKITEFPDGYESKVGEGGVRLTGGEVQRLAMARVLLNKSKIVALDEATSAVDTLTEAEIQKALQRLGSGRTMFVIAHRLSTVVRAHKILVVREGFVKALSPSFVAPAYLQSPPSARLIYASAILIFPRIYACSIISMALVAEYPVPEVVVRPASTNLYIKAGNALKFDPHTRKGKSEKRQGSDSSEEERKRHKKKLEDMKQRREMQRMEDKEDEREEARQQRKYEQERRRRQRQEDEDEQRRRDDLKRRAREARKDEERQLLEQRDLAKSWPFGPRPHVHASKSSPPSIPSLALPLSQALVSAHPQALLSQLPPSSSSINSQGNTRLEVRKPFKWLVKQQLPEDKDEYTHTMEVALDEWWTIDDLRAISDPNGDLYKVARGLKLKDGLIHY